MHKMMMIRYCLLLMLAFGAAADAIALEVPYLSGRLNDHAGLIGPAAKERIENLLRAVEDSNGAQLAVLTVPSLEDEVLEDFSIRVVETWKLGRKGIDDGVLLLVAHDDRKIRIEVGYGLEPVLTDLASRRIIDYLMVPAFRKGDFEGGIESAVKAIAGAIQGDTTAIPEVPAKSDNLMMEIIFLSVFGLFMLPFAYYAVGLEGAGGWVVYGFLAPFFALFPMVAGKTVALVSVGLWLAVIPVLRAVWPAKWRVKADEKVVGLRGSRSRGGRRSSGSSSSGGFSGGGGSFGGGGASGGW
jgi:uncharacterized protein